MYDRLSYDLAPSKHAHAKIPSSRRFFIQEERRRRHNHIRMTVFGRQEADRAVYDEIVGVFNDHKVCNVKIQYS